MISRRGFLKGAFATVVLAAMPPLPSAAICHTEKKALSTFVYRPGGTQGGNVYNNWSDLMNDLDERSDRQKTRTVIFDGGDSGCIEIPAGTYDFKNVTFEAGLQDITVDFKK